MACNALSFQKMMVFTHNSMRPYRLILWQTTIGLHQVRLNSKSLFTTANTAANSTHHSLTSLLAFIGHHKQRMKMAVQCWTLMSNVQQQFGSSDCGLFAIAFTVHLAFGDDPQHIAFEQSQMRPHLLKCFQRKKMEPFPHKKVASIPTDKAPYFPPIWGAPISHGHRSYVNHCHV